MKTSKVGVLLVYLVSEGGGGGGDLNRSIRGCTRPRQAWPEAEFLDVIVTKV
jgi:hypothetical protein